MNKGFEQIFISLKQNLKTIIYCILIFSITIISSMIIYGFFTNPIVLDINGTKYSEDDYMLYLYSNKASLFGENTKKLEKNTLNSLVSKDINLTVREYLEKQTLSQIKTAYVVEELAKVYDIELSKADLEDLEKEKESYIKKLGGRKKFLQLLKDNNTSEKAYDKVAKTDKLYKLIYQNMYSKGKSKDLTDEEYETYKEEYYNKYKKIRQVVLTTIDLNTKEALNISIINQKEKLINSILDEAKAGADFDELIKTYSEDVSGKEGPYYIYYTEGQMVSEIEDAVNNLSDGQISDVIKTEYGYHIIKKDVLDDDYLEKFYDKKREEKLLSDISNKIEELEINNHNAYKNLEIR